MRKARVSPAKGEEKGTGRPGRTGPQRAPPPLMLRSVRTRGAVRPSRARPTVRTSTAMGVTRRAGRFHPPLPGKGKKEEERVRPSVRPPRGSGPAPSGRCGRRENGRRRAWRHANGRRRAGGGKGAGDWARRWRAAALLGADRLGKRGAGGARPARGVLSCRGPA